MGILQRFHPRAWKESAPLSPFQRRVAIGVLAALGFVLVAALSLGGYLFGSAPRFPEPPYRQSSRLYGRSTHLAVGASTDPAELIAELQATGYREAPAGGPLPEGAFSHDRREGETVALRLRRFPTSDGGTGGGFPAEVKFAQGQVAGLTVGGKAAQGLDLEPVLLASYYGPRVEERRPVELSHLPEEVVRPVLAAEDAAFFNHPGVSIPGILRAALANLRGGSVEQGGSTLTQQLVKNLYLTQKRSLSRKLKEAVLAMLIELRHDKRSILEAYLNEIYWGRSGSANLIGLGAAARGYFGKEAAALSLAEAATLAGMIKAPADYSPLAHPERAVERRNHVLQRMVELGWIDRARAAAVEQEPLRTAPESFESQRRRASYFADAMAAEARERWKVDDLAGGGYRLFSTLGWREQRQAESAVAAGLAALEKGPEKRSRRDGPLQASLLSIDPQNGAILAYVGGRDYGKSQFDRIAQARRQAGSAFKPVIYAAALSEGVATPTTLLNDSPIVVRFAGQSWSPQDNDHAYRGWVTVRTALEHSLNIPAVRLALGVGLGKIVTLAHDMGIDGDLEPIPALALGAFGVTPRELAQVYATLASGGTRPVVHGLAAVVDPAGQPLPGKDLPAPHRVLQAQPAYLVTSMLQGVLDRGTAASARNQGVRGELAGKTGTTNGRRDTWFAGYSPDRVTVVWVGYDDNAQSRLSGASAALPIWSRFVAAVRPAGGYPAFTPPPGIVTATVDPTTGQLATAACPYAVTDLFPEWKVPMEPCTQHPADGAAGQLASLGQQGEPPLAPLAPNPGRPANLSVVIPGNVDPNAPDAAPAAPETRPGSILIRRSQGARVPEMGVRPAEPAPPEDDAEGEGGGVLGDDAEDWTGPIGQSAPPPPPPPPPPAGPAVWHAS